MKQDILKKLICFFVFKTKGQITKTRLVEYIYLADLYSVKWTGEQLTNLNWYYYEYAPWHEDIDLALSSMEEKKLIKILREESNLINIGESLQEIDSLNLPRSLVLILENIIKEWSRSSVKELSSYVRQTSPIIDVGGKNNCHEKAKLNLYKERELLLESLNR